MTRSIRTSALWWLARTIAWVFYRVYRLGPPLPDGAVLLVANHPNGLMDPVLIGATAGREPRILAKSTLFAMPVIGTLVRAARAIPVYRRQDVGEDVTRNRDMFAAVDDALADGACVCLFPEGTTHSSGHLAPLKPGAARIALRAHEHGVRLAIVPVGLIFDRKATLRSSATVVYGEAFTVEGLSIAAATDHIATRLRTVMIEVAPDEEQRLVERVERLYSTARSLSDRADERIARQRTIAQGMHALRTRDARRWDAAIDELQRYDRRLARFGLADEHMRSSGSRTPLVRIALREFALAVMLLPVIAVGTALFAIPYGMTDVLVRRLSRHDEEHSTYKALSGIVVHGSWIGLLAAITAWMIDVRVAAALLVLAPVAGVAALLAVERERAMLTAMRSTLAWQRLSPGATRALIAQRRQLADLLDTVYEWLNDPSPFRTDE